MKPVAYISLIAAIILILAVGFFLLLRRTEKKIAGEQNKIFMKQVEEVHTLYAQMRGWRHDYHNHLQTLKAYLSEGNVLAAQTYLSSLESDLSSVRLLSETGNVPVDAILNSKLSLAIENKIKVDYTLNVPKNVSTSDLDLCIILGNLLDNAVESAVKTEDKFIRLYLGVFKRQFYISCVNSTAEKARKIDEAYISNKRGNHGHGLKRIDGAVKKYGGHVNRQNEPGVFATEILLPL